MSQDYNPSCCAVTAVTPGRDKRTCKWRIMVIVPGCSIGNGCVWVWLWAMMLGNIVKNISRLQICSDLSHLPQVLREVFSSVVWTSLNGGRKNHTVPITKTIGKSLEVFPHGREAKIWSQELESVVGTYIFWIAQTYWKFYMLFKKDVAISECHWRQLWFPN